MNIADAKAFAMDKWFDPAYADQITYNGVDIYGHVIYGGNNVFAKHATIIVQVSDVADPQYRDLVEINGTAWRVYRHDNSDVIIKGDGQTLEIPIFKDEKPRVF